MKRSVIVSLSSCVLICLVLSFPVYGNPGTELDRILKLTGEYCRKIDVQSIKYRCKEKVVEKEFTPPMAIRHHHCGPIKTVKNAYLYDYQLVKIGTKIKERRILLKKNRRRHRKKRAKLDVFLRQKYVIVKPGNIFHPQNQKYFNFSILKKIVRHGENILVVSAQQKDPRKQEVLKNRAWIRRKDGVILRFAWVQHSKENQRRWRSRVQNRRLLPRYRFKVDYGLERNQIRYPTRFGAREIYIKRKRRLKLIKSALKVIYSDYRFSESDRFSPNGGDVKIAQDPFKKR